MAAVFYRRTSAFLLCAASCLDGLVVVVRFVYNLQQPNYFADQLEMQFIRHRLQVGSRALRQGKRVYMQEAQRGDRRSGAILEGRLRSSKAARSSKAFLQKHHNAQLSPLKAAQFAQRSNATAAYEALYKRRLVFVGV